MPKPTLVLVYEPEDACRHRLAQQGIAPAHALEISSYLAQSTDIALEFDEIAAACAARGMAFSPVALDDAPGVLGAADPSSTIVWTLSDGIAYFRGGAAPALARLHGLRTLGADDSLFALCQDKFRSGAVMRALGLPVPPAGLARDGAWLAMPPQSDDRLFRQAQPPWRQDRHLGRFALPHAGGGAGAQPPRLCGLSRRCGGAALCSRAQCPRQLSGGRSCGGHRGARHRLRRFGRRFPDDGRFHGALWRDGRAKPRRREPMPNRFWNRSRQASRARRGAWKPSRRR